MSRDILMILKSLAANYPIIYSLGICFTKLLVIFVAPGQTYNLVRVLSNFKVCAINEYMKLDEVKMKLKNANSDFVFFPFSGTKKSRLVLDFLISFVKNHNITDEDVFALPLVVTELGFVDDFQSDMFFIHLEGELSNYDIQLSDVVPQDEELAIVEDQLMRQNKIASGLEERAFMVAICFLYLTYRNERASDEWSVLFRTAQLLVSKDENSHVLDDMGEVFINTLYDWQYNENFSEIYPLPNLEKDIIEHLNQVVLFDKKYLFIPEQVFRSVCGTLLNVYPINSIKEGLVKSEILIPENKKTYSAKFGYYNYAGQYNRGRALRLDRVRLNRIGEMDFIDKCELAKTRRK